MKMDRRAVLGILAGGIMAGALYAQVQTQAKTPDQGQFPPSQQYPPPGDPSPSEPTPISSSDSVSLSEELNHLSALNYLHHVNGVELQEGQNAQANVSSPEASALADALVTDHQANDEQVMELASEKGITLFVVRPSTYELAQQTFLASLSGPSYDEIFMQLQKQDHRDVLARLRTLLNEVKDSDIRNLISQTIPVVEKHLELAGGFAPAPSGSVSPSASPSSSPSPSGSPSPSISPSPSPSPSPSL